VPPPSGGKTVRNGSARWGAAEPGAGVLTQGSSGALGCRRRGLPTASAAEVRPLIGSKLTVNRRYAARPCPCPADVFRAAASG